MYSKIAIYSLIPLLYLSSKATAQPPEYPPSGLRPFGEFRSPEQSNVRQAQFTPIEDLRRNEPVGSALPPPEQLNLPVFAPVEQNKSVWFQPLWEGTIELGMNGSNGNADAFSMKVGASLKRETTDVLWEFDFVHARATANGISTQNNVLSSLRAERRLGDPDWSLFGKGAL